MDNTNSPLIKLGKSNFFSRGQRTQSINALRGHLAEFGVVAPQGPVHVERLASALEDPDRDLPDAVRDLAGLLLNQIAGLGEKIDGLDREIRAAARQDDEVRRLMTVPGIGPITAMAVQAFAPPMEGFRRGRDFAAWLGLVPRQHTTGGKPRLGKILKMGQRDLRRLLITGAMAVVRWVVRRGTTNDPWLARMLMRKPRMLVAVALANRMARIVWALMTKKESYRARGTPGTGPRSMPPAAGRTSSGRKARSAGSWLPVSYPSCASVSGALSLAASNLSGSSRAMRRPMSRASVITAASIRASAPPSAPICPGPGPGDAEPGDPDPGDPDPGNPDPGLSLATTPRMAIIPRSLLSGIFRELPQQYAPGSRIGPAIRPCQTRPVLNSLHRINVLSAHGTPWQAVAAFDYDEKIFATRAHEPRPQADDRQDACPR